jgi:FMN phosphatase YigB (HAD superfamily)
MKFIFDFDDVLFHTNNENEFRGNIYSKLEKVGISRDLVKEYIERERESKDSFSLKKMLIHFSVPESLYEEIMHECKNFVNKELLEIIKKLGKKNCFILSYGQKEYQQDKIKRAGIIPLFSEITITLGSKKEAVEKICAKHKGERVIFIDDKARHFEDLDFKKYPNLETILYDEQGFEKLLSILPP